MSGERERIATIQLEQDMQRMGLMAVSGPHRCLVSGELLYWCKDGAFRSADECIGADECAGPDSMTEAAGE